MYLSSYVQSFKYYVDNTQPNEYTKEPKLVCIKNHRSAGQKKHASQASIRG